MMSNKVFKMLKLKEAMNMNTLDYFFHLPSYSKLVFTEVLDVLGWSRKCQRTEEQKQTT